MQIEGAYSIDACACSLSSTVALGFGLKHCFYNRWNSTFNSRAPLLELRSRKGDFANVQALLFFVPRSQHVSRETLRRAARRGSLSFSQVGSNIIRRNLVDGEAPAPIQPAWYWYLCGKRMIPNHDVAKRTTGRNGGLNTKNCSRLLHDNLFSKVGNLLLPRSFIALGLQRKQP